MPDHLHRDLQALWGQGPVGPTTLVHLAPLLGPDQFVPAVTAVLHGPQERGSREAVALLVARIPSDALRAVVDGIVRGSGRWSGSDESMRARAVLRLAPALGTDLAQRAEAGTASWSNASARRAVRLALRSSRRDGHLRADEMEGALTRINDPALRVLLRADFLRVVSDDAVDPLRRTQRVLGDLSLVSAQEVRSDLLGVLAPTTEDASGLIRSLPDLLRRSWDQAKVLVDLAGDGRPEDKYLVVDLALRLRARNARVWCLAWISGMVEAPLRRICLLEAIATTYRIRSAWSRAEAVVILAGAVPRELLGDVARAAEDIRSTTAREWALGALEFRRIAPGPLSEQRGDLGAFAQLRLLSRLSDLSEAELRDRLTDVIDEVGFRPERFLGGAGGGEGAPYVDFHPGMEGYPGMGAARGAPSGSAPPPAAGVEDEPPSSPLLYRAELARAAYVREQPLTPDLVAADRGRRVVGVGFTSAPVGPPRDPDLPLECGGEYLFWFGVDTFFPASIEAEPKTLPTEHLREGARLSVALYPVGDLPPAAVDGEPGPVRGRDTGELRLNPDGSVSVTRQPAPELLEQAEPGLPESVLFLPVRAPATPGELRFRCNVYYEGTLLQSRLVRARTMKTPTRTKDAFHSEVDYTLTRSLDPQRFAALTPQRLSLMIDGDPGGTHRFCFFGGGETGAEFKSEVTLDPHKVQQLTEGGRNGLRKVSWGFEAEWTRKDKYRYGVAPGAGCDLRLLREDLAFLAQRGYRIYFALRQELGGDSDGADRLRELMRTPGEVQIVMKRSTQHALPAALIYDSPVDPDAPPSQLGLCDAFIEARSAAEPLEDSPCFQGACPNHGNAMIVCPSGFWGYRHVLSFPPSLGKEGEIDPEIRVEDELQFTAGRSTDPRFRLWNDHEAALRQLRNDPSWWRPAAANYVALMNAFRTSTPHIVYLYCHGGTVQSGMPEPYLQVGPPDEPKLTPSALLGVSWKATRPVVLINGCETTALAPEMALQFVDTFIKEVGASGVIGTDVTIFEPLAVAFAEACLRRFVQNGETMGRAVRGARLELLKRCNPLGLVYVPYLLGAIHLRWPESN